MQSGQQPNDKQFQKLMSFMIHDPYFQNDLIEQITKSEDSEWIATLSKDAQVRFL